jgi:hypothetical protein
VPGQDCFARNSGGGISGKLLGKVWGDCFRSESEGSVDDAFIFEKKILRKYAWPLFHKELN